jgi:hypothetical protein
VISKTLIQRVLMKKMGIPNMDSLFSRFRNLGSQPLKAIGDEQVEQLLALLGDPPGLQDVLQSYRDDRGDMLVSEFMREPIVKSALSKMVSGGASEAGLDLTSEDGLREWLENQVSEALVTQM